MQHYCKCFSLDRERRMDRGRLVRVSFVLFFPNADEPSALFKIGEDTERMIFEVLMVEYQDPRELVRELRLICR